jgi:lysozyme family protein
LSLQVIGDGRIGPLTLHALDNARPDEVLESLDDQAIAFYHVVVEKDPSKERYLNGWLKRAEA